MSRTQRKYDQEYKIQAVKLAKEIGGAKAAKELGIPEGTTGLSFEQTAYDSQHQQCECVRHCRSSYRNAYATMT